MIAKLLVAAGFATAILAAAIYHQHSSLLAQASTTDGSWQQPSSLNSHFSTPVSSGYWPFDFRDMDKPFAKFVDEKRDALRVDSSLARQFKQSIEALPRDLAQDDLKRIELLLQKSYAGSAGQELAKLFAAMYRFQHSQRELSAELAAQLPVGSLQLASQQLEQELLLQRQHFSPAQANQLFGESNRTARYLLERLRIRQDTSLSAEQQRSALERLQQDFKAGP